MNNKPTFTGRDAQAQSVANLQGWGKIGYALSGGYNKDRDERAMIQQADYELRQKFLSLQAAGNDFQYDEDSGNYIPRVGSERELMENQVKHLNAQITQMQNNNLKQGQNIAISDFIQNLNTTSFNNLLKTDENQKSFFNKLNVAAIEKFDVLNPAHINVLNQTGEQNSDYIVNKFKPLVANIRNENDELIGENGKIISKEEEEVLKNEYDSLGRLYPIVRGADNVLSMILLEDFIAMSGLFKNDINQTNVNKSLDLLAKSRQALNGFTNKMIEEQERAAGLANDSTKFTLDGLNQLWKNSPNMTLDEALQVLKIQPMQEKSASASYAGGTTQANSQRYAYLMEKYNKGTASQAETFELRALDAQLNGSNQATATWGIGGGETSRGLVAMYNQATGENVTSIADVDIRKVPLQYRNNIFQAAAGEYAKLNTDDKKKLDAIDTAANSASKINLNKIKESSGLIDASMNAFMDWTGLTRDTDLVKNEAYMASVVAVLTHALYGSQLTDIEYQNAKKKFGDVFQADETFKIRFRNALEQTLTSLDKFKTIAPNYYATNIKAKADVIKDLMDELDGDKKPNKKTNFDKIEDIPDNTKVMKEGKMYIKQNGKLEELGK